MDKVELGHADLQVLRALLSVVHKHPLLTFIAMFLPSANKHRRPKNLQINAVSDIGGEAFDRKN